MRALIMCSLLFLLVVSLLSVSCVRTEDKLFTAISECKAKEKLNDPNSTGDAYDYCMILTDDELRSADGCRNRCETYCKGRNMLIVNSWTDVSGCRCTCKVNLRSG